MTVYFDKDFLAFTSKKDDVYFNEKNVENKNEAIGLIKQEVLSETENKKNKRQKLKRKIKRARGLIIQSKSYNVSHNKYENKLFDYIVEYKKQIEEFEIEQ